MSKMKTLLISGKGPGHLENEDLINSGMDPNFDEVDRKKYYVVDSFDFNPERLIYKNNDLSFAVLRDASFSVPEVITSVLETILKDNDLDFESISIEDIWKDYKLSKKTDVVCLSTSFMWSEAMLNHSIEWIKRNVAYKHLIVGGQYSVLKKDYLLKKHKGIDYIVTGDAELSLPRLIKSIEKRSGLDEIIKIPNLTFLDEKNNMVSTESISGNINSYKTPEYEGKFDKIRYISMKGCPYSCKFCALRVSTPEWRYLDVKRMIDDLKKYKIKNNIKHVDINDSTFFIPFKKRLEFLDLMSEIGLNWKANARADTDFDPEIIKKLENSGCTSLYFGFESMNDKVLDYMNKRTTVKDNLRINDLFKDSEINTKMSFIVGYPGETPEDHLITRDYLLNDHFGHYNLYIFEFEGDSMPVWEDREKFDLKIYDDKTDEYDWKHGGENWEHIGMNSATAKKLREETIKIIRTSKSQVIHKTWQYRFKTPIIEHLSRKENIEIEKLIDQLVFIRLDYSDEDLIKERLFNIKKDLNDRNIYYPDKDE